MTADVPGVNTADEREPYCDRCDDTGWLTWVAPDGAGWSDPCPKCGRPGA